MAARLVPFDLEGDRGAAVPCALHEGPTGNGAAVVPPGRVPAEDAGRSLSPADPAATARGPAALLCGRRPFLADVAAGAPAAR